MEYWISLLQKQMALYPKMQLSDIIKLAYQHTLGTEHAVISSQQSLLWLEEELAALKPQSQNGFDDIGGGFCRLHLGGLTEQGLSPVTLNAMFVATSRASCGNRQLLAQLLRQVPLLCQNGVLPFDGTLAKETIEEYIASGCPAVHHSPQFRAAYAPAYRVIRQEFVHALPLFCAIDAAMSQKQKLLVAIDGNSGGGKSTLGRLLSQVYSCNVFHMDDYFLQLHQRTPQRFAQAGGNIDHERFAAEILAGVQSGRPFVWRRFDCSQMALGQEVLAEPKPLTIVEGVYSLHPALAKAYDLKVFVSIDPALQSSRILARNGEAIHRRFMEEWIPLENRYFAEYKIQQQCHLVLQARA